MAFKLIAAAAALSFAAHAALADEPTDPVTQTCKEGFAWRVPPKKPGEATNEQTSLWEMPQPRIAYVTARRTHPTAFTWS